MKNKHLKQSWFLTTAFVLAAAFVIATYFYSKTLAIIGGLGLFLTYVGYLIVRKYWRKEHFDAISELTKNLDADSNNMLTSMSMPTLLCYEDGSVVWFNEFFRKEVASLSERNSKFLGDYLDEGCVQSLFTTGKAYAEIDNNCYTVYSSKVTVNKKECYLIYFFDITELKIKADTLEQMRPAVIIGMYDNFDEMFQNLSDSELSELTSYLDKEVSKWFSDHNCVMRKLGSERFVVTIHEKDLVKMTEDKFSILGSVRDFVYDGKACLATLSIGVGRGENLKDCDFNAKQALDMALSRGGDQVAIKTDDGFEFYGGLASGNEKGNKVRSRVVASAIKQLIMTCENCLVLGHKFSDYDAMGASIGIYSMMKHFEKDVNIVYDSKNSLCEKLVTKYVSETGNKPFVDKNTALQMLTENTLVFLVDTHRAAYCESPEIVNNAKMVVVIDHHRKSVDFYDKAVVFHHNSSASSASEMLAELMPYMSNSPIIGPPEADALLSGIMLDTKNFVLRSGVRTFEAASYLKSRGADPVKVKKLFSSTADEHKMRAEIVSNCFIYRDCAISVAKIKGPDGRVVTSQAADEMLNISGVKASFVIFKTENITNISARSLGDLNVQLVMERLGGGGHLTMAAAQINNSDTSDSLVMLKKAIDEYYDSL